jgi:hypothetical protein
MCCSESRITITHARLRILHLSLTHQAVTLRQCTMLTRIDLHFMHIVRFHRAVLFGDACYVSVSTAQSHHRIHHH